MSLTVSEGSKTKNYERPEPGSVAGRCYMIVDLGTHDNTHPQAPKGATKQEVMIFFELSGDVMEDGRPFVVNKRYTASLGDRAILRKDLAAWRGRDFTPEELAGFSLPKILGHSAMLNLVEKENKKDPKNPYINIAGISPLPKGMNVDEPSNEQLTFDIEEMHTEKFGKLYRWVRNIIRESHEAKQAEAEGNPLPTEEELDPEKEGGDHPSDNGQTEDSGPKDDEIPF